MKIFIEAVIFDMDGVVVDSTRHWQQIVQPFMSRHIEEWDGEKAMLVAGVKLEDMHRLLVAKWNFPLAEEDFYEFTEATAREVYLHRTSLLPGLRELLSLLIARNFRLGLASSSPQRWVQMVLQRFQLHSDFHEILTSENVIRGKPAPDIFLLAAQKLRVVPQNCLVIEDSVSGVMGAKSAGMHCIGITTTLSRDRLNQADRVVSSMFEIQRFFEDDVT